MTQNPVNPPLQTATPGDPATTLGLIAALQATPQRPLEFWLDGQPLVPPGYHVTEVKAVSIEAMDCGGKAASWRETVIQLMDGSPQDARAGFMTTRKFLSIYGQVTRQIPVRGEAEVRFEYGDTSSPALQYHVSGLEAQPQRVLIHLRAPGVQCKAGDACGLPASPSSPNGASSDESCAPGSGCCTPAAPDLITLG